MALARVKNWVYEKLTYSDLNAEFNNILNNPGSLICPITFHLTFTDATYDIGASGATRPRDLFLSRNATIGGTLAVTGVSSLGVINTASFLSTATAAGTTTLTVDSALVQEFTGTTTQTVVMPVTSTLTTSWKRDIINNSTGALTINSSGGNLVLTLRGGSRATITCVLASGTTAASWAVSNIAPVRNSFTGTLTGVSGSVTGTIKYTFVDDQVVIDVPSDFTGTSNATSKTITGMPAVIFPAANKTFFAICSDNGGANTMAQGVLDTSGVLTIYSTIAGGNWTASGTATISRFTFSYLLS